MPTSSASDRTPPEALAHGWRLMRLAQERQELDLAMAAAVRQILAAGGSWTTVAMALGVTRQAARQMYAPLLDRPDSTVRDPES